MASIGIVLGAGGVVGGAWHAGVLAALEAETGWDPRAAAVAVGTSAGSVVAASLRSGLSAADQRARALGEVVSPAGTRLLGTADDVDLRLRPPRSAWPANVLLPLRAAVPPWHWRPLLALAGALPRGTTPTAPIGDRLRAVAGGAWPERPTWIVAVRLRDGHRVVLGRDELPGGTPDLGTAVEASCAVPGLFRPVRIGGQDHVDGGVHSTTNADLVADLGLDAVVVSAPMAGRFRAARPSPQSISRLAARAALDRELGPLRRAGIPVLVVQPGRADVEAMGGPSMDPARRAAAVAAAHRSVTARLTDERAGPAAEVLRTAAR